MSRILHPDADRAAAAYLGTSDLGEPLGSGTDGVVYSTPRTTAIKVFSRNDKFKTELAAYERLHEHRVTAVCGFSVPQLIDFSRELRVIEMSIIRPPCVFDFGKCTLDHRADYTEDALQTWHDSIVENFEDNWPVAMQIFAELRTRYGIYHEDISPRNVRFAGSTL